MEGGAVEEEGADGYCRWNRGRQYHGSGQRREEAATSVLAGEKRRAAKHQESSDPQ